MSGYDWVPCYNFNIPHNAVKCGTDLDGSEIYVGLSHYNGDELPCKIVPRRRVAYISHNGKEITVSEFKILCEKALRWLPSSNGGVPKGAIPAGRTINGETLYIGRTSLRNVTVVGKVHPSHGCLYVPYDGKEVAYKQYEVLVFH
ncbi:natterin-3-like [Zophobas morio]|uniref:natterin-3-like n=1 Tax=Zophobas morio TaxID=2755281 RepID=UPI003082F785